MGLGWVKELETVLLVGNYNHKGQEEEMRVSYANCEDSSPSGLYLFSRSSEK